MSLDQDRWSEADEGVDEEQDEPAWWNCDANDMEDVRHSGKRTRECEGEKDNTSPALELQQKRIKER
eukprot:3862177-Amphidinium_carterae.1